MYNKNLGMFLKSKYNRGVCVHADYYNNIKEWDSWYKGRVESFHKVLFNNGVKTVSRDIESLGMAQQVAQDWSSSLYNEDVIVTINTGRDSVDRNKTSVFLQGSNGNGGVLQSTNFKVEMSNLIEQAFALGTGAIVVNATNISVDANGVLVNGKTGRVDISFINALSIIPITSVNNRVVECSFISERVELDQVYSILQTHLLEDGKYVIYNSVLDSAGAEVDPTTFGIIPKLETGRDKPLFAIIKPCITNVKDYSSPLGQSIFANAIGVLKSLDLINDSFTVEFIIGQKLVFMDRRLFGKDDKGNLIAPQDAKQYFMQIVGDNLLMQDKPAVIQEYSPELRVDDHNKAMQQYLDVLSLKCGLGIKAYEFTGSSVVSTATQYVGQRNDYVRNLKKNNHMLESVLKSVFSSILWVGSEILGYSIVADSNITIELPDGVVEDDSSEKEQDRQDVREGLMLPWEFRVKWYGESEEDAKAKIAESNKTRNNTNTNTNNEVTNTI